MSQADPMIEPVTYLEVHSPDRARSREFFVDVFGYRGPRRAQPPTGSDSAAVTLSPVSSVRRALAGRWTTTSAPAATMSV